MHKENFIPSLLKGADVRNQEQAIEEANMGGLVAALKEPIEKEVVVSAPVIVSGGGAAPNAEGDGGAMVKPGPTQSQAEIKKVPTYIVGTGPRIGDVINPRPITAQRPTVVPTSSAPVRNQSDAIAREAERIRAGAKSQREDRRRKAVEEIATLRDLLVQLEAAHNVEISVINDQHDTTLRGIDSQIESTRRELAALLETRNIEVNRATERMVTATDIYSEQKSDVEAMLSAQGNYLDTLNSK